LGRVCQKLRGYNGGFGSLGLHPLVLSAYAVAGGRVSSWDKRSGPFGIVNEAFRIPKMQISKERVNRVLAVFLISMTITSVYVLWRSRSGAALGYGDYASFYTAGTLVRRGEETQLYDRDAQWRVQQEFASEVKIRRGPLRYIRPAYEAALFWCFAAWPYPTSLLLWTAFKFLLLIAIPFICVVDVSGENRIPPWAAGILSLGTFPVFLDFFQGQDTVLLTFLFAIAYRLLTKEMDGWAGLAFGLGLFKFHIVVPLVLMLWIAGRRRIAFGFAPTAVAVVAMSAVIVGWRGFLQYPEYLLRLNQTQGVGVVVPEVQVNLRGLLTLFVGRSPYPGRIHWILLPIALAAIICAGRAWRRAGKARLAEGFGLALTCTILTTYYAYAYDLSLLSVPLLAMWSRRAERPLGDPWARTSEVVGTALLLCTPLHWFVFMRLHEECLMAIPLLVVGIGLALRLRRTPEASPS